VAVHNLKRWLRRRWQKATPWFKSFITAVLLACLSLCLLSDRRVGWLEYYLVDYYFSHRGAIAPPSEVFLVSVDDESFNRLHMRTATPRALWIDTIQKLATYPIKGLFLDFVFSDNWDPNIDQRLADVMKKAPTIIGSLYHVQRDKNPDGTVAASIRGEEPIELFRNAAHRVVSTNVSLDYGVSRRFFSLSGNGYAPTMADVVYGDNLTGKALPNPRDFINYYGHPGTIEKIPLWKFLDAANSLPQDRLKNKLVFVGVELGMQYTSFPQTGKVITPFGQPSSVVEIHATAAANIIRGDWIRRLAPEDEATLMFIATAFLAYLLLSLKPIQGAILLLSTIAGWSAFSYFMFLHLYFIPGVLMFILLTLTWIFTCGYYYLLLRKIETALGVKLEPGR
jgi:CHASE2 domain-containing sensor protein